MTSQQKRRLEYLLEKGLPRMKKLAKSDQRLVMEYRRKQMEQRKAEDRQWEEQRIEAH